MVECVEGRAEFRHVDQARFAAEGFLLQVGALQAGAIEAKRLRGGELEPAAGVFPRARERGQQADGADGHGAALAALDAVIQADGGRPRGGIFAGEGDDFVRGDAGEFGGALRGPRQHAIAEGIEAIGVARDVIGIVEVLADDDVHEGEGQGGIAAGVDEEVLVGGGSGAIAAGVDGVEAGTLAAGFHDEGPEMHVGAEDIGAPGDDEPGVAELFGLGAVADAEGLGHAGHAGGGADGAVQARGAEAMEEAAVHAFAIEQAHGSGVAVGEDGLGSELARRWRRGGRRWCRGLRPRRCAGSGLRLWRPTRRWG